LDRARTVFLVSSPRRRKRESVKGGQERRLKDRQVKRNRTGLRGRSSAGKENAGQRGKKVLEKNHPSQRGDIQYGKEKKKEEEEKRMAHIPLNRLT